jgi:predicted SPOUT superfamily RNA methylase MTH1
MAPSKRIPSLTLAVPASLTSDTPHLREKTFKVGLIGRAAAVFRVDEILVFPDRPDKDQSRDLDFLHTILSYMDTPQYLRRYLFPITPSLKYAGVLPPLRTPHHPISKKVGDLQPGHFRDGVVVRTDNSASFVDIGVDKLAVLREERVPPKSRLTAKTLRVIRGVPEISMANREEINIYWGYGVTVSNLSLGRVINHGSYDFVVMTSRHGKSLPRVLDTLKNRWRRARKVLVAFGSPKEGLTAILTREKIKIRDIADVIINTIPQQGTETVRTEEAVYATLALVNTII